MSSTTHYAPHCHHQHHQHHHHHNHHHLHPHHQKSSSSSSSSSSSASSIQRHLSLPTVAPSSSSSAYLLFALSAWLLLFLLQLSSTRAAASEDLQQQHQFDPPQNISSSSSSSSSSKTDDAHQSSTDCRHGATLCPAQLKQRCDQQSGRCTCPDPSAPIRLSAEIPCLRAKALGEVCLHSLECAPVANAACYATILFPLELQSVPSHRQWYIYAQITESGELNYLLNKVYGQCRCRSGYRAVSPRRCVQKQQDAAVAVASDLSCSGAEAEAESEAAEADQLNSTAQLPPIPGQCAHLLAHSHCDVRRRLCTCDGGFSYDETLKSCRRGGGLPPSHNTDRHGQFCVVNGDCLLGSSGASSAAAADPNLTCVKSRCVCAQGFTRAANESACPPPRQCPAPGQSWNSASLACESHSPVLYFDSLLVKIVLLLLLKLILCNLVRIACYSKRRFPSSALDHHHQRHHHRGLRFFESTRRQQMVRSDQSRSLLSLPPYESICQSSSSGSSTSESCSVVGASSASAPAAAEDRADSLPPTYEEALQTMGGAAAEDSYKRRYSPAASQESVAVL